MLTKLLATRRLSEEALAALSEDALIERASVVLRKSSDSLRIALAVGLFTVVASLWLFHITHVRAVTPAFISNFLVFISCMTAGMLLHNWRSVIYFQEFSRLHALATCPPRYCERAFSMVMQSAQARAWRDRAVANGRQLRMFDYDKMRQLWQVDCGAFAKERHLALCKKLHDPMAV